MLSALVIEEGEERWLATPDGGNWNCRLPSPTKELAGARCFHPSLLPSSQKFLLIQFRRKSLSHYEGYSPLSPVHLWAVNHLAICVGLGSGRILNLSKILITSSQSRDYYPIATHSKLSVSLKINRTRWDPRFWPSRKVEPNSLPLQAASPH